MEFVYHQTMIKFRSLASTDLRLLHQWLQEGPVLKWYAKQLMTFDQVKRKFLPYVQGKRKTKAFIILFSKQPIGYIQTYRAVDYPKWNKFIKADKFTAGLDLFIGENDFRGRGLGSEIIREFLKQIVFQWPLILTCIGGPDPANTASKRALEKAGFKFWKTIHPPEGEEYLMSIEKANNKF